VLVPLSLVGGLAGAAADAWAPAARVLEPIASAILAIAGWTASLLTALAAASAAVPGASLVVPAPNVVELSLYFVALIATVLVVRRVRFARGVALAAAITLVAEVGALAASRHFDDTLRVVFLPVGQGDGIVVELPRGRVMVIDTGPGGRGPGTSAVERVIVPYLRARRIGRVDRVVLTHPHADHAGGLAALTASVEVGEVWWNGDVREGPPGLAALAAELGARRVDAPLGAETIDGVTIEVLGPARAPTRYDEVNDGSIVLRVAYGSRAFVLGGDAEAEAEAELVARGGLRADVLKAGHHGSRSSTTEAFLAAVAPAHVVLCLGKDNSFGFPHREVSERLARAGVHVWRTDLDGQVTFSTDGVHLDVAPFLDRARGAVDER
ncbi:MBL fold metallo-hydrolase, partial [Myxococcota bacterium]|nr:MBL fold metallo-hydrolase [Myxococcota bacterium]